MKRLLATLLAAMLLLACIPAMAEANAPELYPELGMAFDIDAIIGKTVNYISFEASGVDCHDPYVATARVLYFGMPLDDILALRDSATTEEEYAEVMGRIYTLCSDIGYIMVTDAADVNTALHAIGFDGSDDLKVEEITAQDNWHYYYITHSEDSFLSLYDDPKAVGLNMTPEEGKAAKEKIMAELDQINAELKEMIRTCDLTTPEDPDGDVIGQTIQFETTDLDGNPVKSEDLFKDNKITMVNLWGTWCPACVGELGELAEIHTRLQEKGCGIVGLEYERGSALEDYKESAVALLAENKVAYPNALLPGDNPVLELVNGFPTSFFVDSEGKILTYAICGCFVNQYEPTVDKLLAGEAVEALPDNGAAANDEGKYNVYVYDREGKPLEGVVIQFCDDTTCSFQNTDANGLATFQVKEPKVYDVHVLQAPEGFRQDEQAYKTLEDFSDVSIFLDRAE